MKFKNFIQINLMIIVMLSAFTYIYSREKKHIAIEERYRTLSLPPRTWEIAPGMEFWNFFDDDGRSSEFSFDLFNIRVPYIPLGNRGELHFLGPGLKFYPIKNVIEIDSVMIISGPNLALFSGIYNFGYSSATKLMLDYGVGYQFKTFLSEKTWLFSSGNGKLDLNNRWDTDLTLGTGFQCTKRFSILTTAKGTVYESTSKKMSVDNNIYKIYTDKGYHYTLTIPIDFKFNRNRSSGLLIRTGFRYVYDSAEHYDHWGVPIGFQYSWHW